MSSRYLTAWDVSIAMEMYLHPPAAPEIFEFQHTIVKKLEFEASQICVGTDWIAHHPVITLLVIAAVRTCGRIQDPRYKQAVIRENSLAFDQCIWLANEIRRQEQTGGQRRPIQQPLAAEYIYPG